VPGSGAAPTGVRMLSRMSIPIFIAAGKDSPGFAAQELAVQDGRFAFILRNGGNAHVDIDRVTVVARDKEGAIKLEKSQTAGTCWAARCEPTTWRYPAKFAARRRSSRCAPKRVPCERRARSRSLPRIAPVADVPSAPGSHRRVLAALFRAPVARAEERALLDLIVNGIKPRHDPGRAGRQGRADHARDAGPVGLAKYAQGIVGYDGRSYVSFASLRPQVHFYVDTVHLRVVLDVPLEYLPPTLVDLSFQRPEGFTQHFDTSAFLNYSAQVLDRNYRLVGEGGLSMGGNLLYSSVLAVSGQDRPVRGLSNYVIDQSRSLRRWTLGDTSSPPVNWAAGRSWAACRSRAASTWTPYYGAHAHEELRRRGAGPVDPRGLCQRGPGAPRVLAARSLSASRTPPCPPGRASCATSCETPSAARTDTAQRAYLSSGTLRRGVSDYAHVIGVQRANVGRYSFDYDIPTAAGRHRRGLTDWLTAGVRYEVTHTWSAAALAPCSAPCWAHSSWRALAA